MGCQHKTQSIIIPIENKRIYYTPFRNNSFFTIYFKTCKNLIFYDNRKKNFTSSFERIHFCIANFGWAYIFYDTKEIIAKTNECLQLWNQ